jgi:hypothetical protein
LHRLHSNKLFLIFEEMKIKILYAVLLVKLLVQSCEKDKSDFRNEMTGNYQFTIEMGGYPPSYTVDTILFYDGYIQKSDRHNDRIIVDWGNDTIGKIDGIYFSQKSEFIVDENGNLEFPDWYGSGNTYFGKSSFVRNDTISFFISIGGLGSWKNWDVLGIKSRE